MTTDTLDFPAIEAPPAIAAAPLTVTPPPALPEVPSIKATVLAQFKEAEVTINALAETYRDVAYDVATTKGMGEAKAARLELREKGRFAVQRAEESVKADVNDLKRVMADEVARLVAIVRPVEDAIDAQIKAEEARKAAAKLERDRIEAERVARHQAGIAKIGAYLARCQEPGITADRISIGIGMLEGVTFGPEWQEFSIPAANAQCETLEAMRNLHAQAVEREAEAARLEAQRIERARIAEEMAAEQERQRVEQARIAAEQAEQQRKLDAQAAEFKANMDRIAGHQRRIDEIKAAATGHIGQPAATIADAITAVAALDVSEAGYQEMAPLAAAAQASTLSVLWNLQVDAAERERIAAVAVAKFNAERTPEPANEIPEVRAEQKVLKAEPEMADATDRGNAANTSPRGGAMGAGQAATAAPAVVAIRAAEPATLNLGAINARFGGRIKLDAAGLMLMGIDHSATDKSARLYRESDIGRICRALVALAVDVQESQAVAA